MKNVVIYGKESVSHEKSRTNIKSMSLPIHECLHP